MISYAQNREDVMLQRVFASTGVGFYVDVGAHHPVRWSVTKHFYERGWRGVNIEPGPMYDALVADRRRDVNLRVAVSDRQGTATFFEFPPEMGVSTLIEAQAVRQAAAHDAQYTPHEVPLRTLADVCREHVHEPIDFMSIDVEGSERQVIAGGDWRRWRPKILLVEATVPNQPDAAHESWEQLLLDQEFLFAYFDGLNRFYVRAEDRQLAEVFRVPPNIFDQYEIYDYLEQLAALESQFQQQQRHAELQFEDHQERILQLQTRLHEFERLGRFPFAVARRVHGLLTRFPRAYMALKRAGKRIVRRGGQGIANNATAGAWQDPRQLEQQAPGQDCNDRSPDHQQAA